MPKRKASESKEKRWLHKMKKYEEKLAKSRRRRYLSNRDDEEMPLSDDGYIKGHSSLPPLPSEHEPDLEITQDPVPTPGPSAAPDPVPLLIPMLDKGFVEPCKDRKRDRFLFDKKLGDFIEPWRAPLVIDVPRGGRDTPAPAPPVPAAAAAAEVPAVAAAAPPPPPAATAAAGPARAAALPGSGPGQNIGTNQVHAGCLKYYLQEWQTITRDVSILNVIKGYKIPFMDIPNQCLNYKTKQSLAEADMRYLDSEILRLIKIKAIRRCEPTLGQFVSSIFLIPKSDGGKRFILNLKKLNKFVKCDHFKMEDIRTATRLMTRNCFMVNLDLKEAYFFIPIHVDHTKFLRFYYNDILYEFLALPFGLSSAPYIFTKLLKPVVAHLRSRGIISVQYLDDQLCIGKSYESCRSHIDETTSLFSKLGFEVNYKKSNLVPSKSCRFLGFILNSEKMTIELPLEKKDDIYCRTEAMLNTNSLPIRSFARFLGSLTASCPAVSYGWAHTKSLERAKYIALLKNNENYDRIMKIPSNIRDDLIWWRSNIKKSFNTLKSNIFELEIYTDASPKGWGAACNGERIGGAWNEEECNHHINYLELQAVYFGLISFANKYNNCEILLRVDNTTAISYVNRMGGVQYTHLNSIARLIWDWCEKRSIFIFASYVKSSHNTEADYESRNIDTEWELNFKSFDKILYSFGKPQIDLFASRSNAKCKKYISWKRDPFAHDIDAFTVNWRNFYFYAFPPFALVLKVLQKIMNDEATGIVVVPYWPSQPWFPMFNSLSIGNTLIFKPSKTLLQSNFRQEHPLHRHLSLAASVLSGRPSPGNKSRHQRSA